MACKPCHPPLENMAIIQRLKEIIQTPVHAIKFYLNISNCAWSLYGFLAMFSEGGQTRELLTIGKAQSRRLWQTVNSGYAYDYSLMDNSASLCNC